MSWWVPWFSPAVAQTWWDPAWEHRAKLTFDNGERAEDLVDFPVLAVLTDGVNFDHSLADALGGDLRFVDPDGRVIPHEIEVWNESGGSAIWVAVPRIDAHSATDHVWLYFGGPTSGAGRRPAETWPDAAAVWHLDGFADSTAGAHQLWDDDSTDQGLGLVGEGRVLSGDDSQLKAADHPDFDLQAGFTVSASIATDGWNDDHDAVVTKGDDTFRLHRCGSAPHLAFAVTFDDDGLHDVCGTTALDDGVWHQVVGVYDPDAGLQTLYVDGAMDGQEGEVRVPKVSGAEVWIGNNQDDSDRALEGRVDEVRIEPVARSAAWISADHASVQDRFVTWCTPVLGLGDTDGDGVCDEDYVPPGGSDDPMGGVTTDAPREGPRAVGDAVSGVPIGCGCNSGPGLPLVLPVWLWFRIRSGCGASAGSRGSRLLRARGRSASRATRPLPPGW